MKNLLLFSIVFVLISVPSLYSQTQWDKTFGGTGNDRGYAVDQALDEGYIIAGITNSIGSGSYDAWLIKTNSLGNSEWNKTFGGSENDYCYDVKTVSEGGFIAVGSTESYGAGSADIWLIRTDAIGNELWKHTYGGSAWDEGDAICQSSDGGFIVTGFTESSGAGFADVFLMKTNSSGTQEWFKTYGGFLTDKGNSVTPTSDNGYIIAGQTTSYGNGEYDVSLIKMDGSGNKKWEKTFGGSDWDWAESVVQCNDGGYILVGYTSSFGAGNYDLWLIKTDANGNEVWNKTYGGYNWDGGEDITQTLDGGFIISGGTSSFGPNGRQLWLLKIDPNGQEQWSETFGGMDTETGFSVIQTNGLAYVTTGLTNSYGAGQNDVWLLYYYPGEINMPPYSPTLLTPANESVAEAGPITFSWINNGDPESDPVGSWMFIVGPWEQNFSVGLGAAGFVVGEVISVDITLLSGQDWYWTIYIYDPAYHSDPYYSYQQPFWHFSINNK